MEKPIDPHSVPTQTFDWGIIKWLVKPEYTLGTGLTFGEVILLPGKGHERHNHPESEEILYVLSGEGEQMVNDEEPFTIKAGDTIYVSIGVYHSTINTGWEPLRLIALYNPAGAERALETAPDFQEVPAGQLAGLQRQAQ
ncbi:cupin domain-containing protein [Dictyobacter kobayashii]|uniref:Cupin 2 domain-containing protein n=1 Tax=Dictyobacter kobayashii TaxID=2014872 RepID=A0A402AXE8_9CHLR|nr:cupin domain-containing protein [Dictyobacter kobayashii]GCE23801.1 cupin 2 domain-containing protein [Dictyobacter kobayashii]